MTNEEREGIERRADIARFKLSRTLQALARKKRDPFDVREKVKHHLVPVGLVPVAAAFALGGAVAVVAVRAAKKKKEHHRRLPWILLTTRVLKHRHRDQQPSDALAPPLGKNLVRVLVTTILAELAKRLVVRFIAAPRKRDVAFDVPQQGALRVG